MKKRHLVLLIPLLLLNLSCSLISGFVSPGVIVRLAPDTTSAPDSATLQKASQILKARMAANLKGKFVLQIQNNSELLAVLYDPNELEIFTQIATKIGEVDFIDSVTPYTKGDAIDVTTQNIILTEMDVSTVAVVPGSQAGTSDAYVISIMFTTDGAKKLDLYTKNNVGHYLVIVQDGIVITSPAVNSEIDKGSAIIQGKFTQADANDLASILKTHRMPFKLKIITTEKRPLVKW